MVYYMNNINGIQNGELIIPGTDVLFINEYHIFSLIIKKPGVTAGMGSSAGATIPDRFAVVNIIVRVGLMSPPLLQLK
jgi:hypothetical protein